MSRNEWLERLERLHTLGRSALEREHQVIDLIASDNAYPSRVATRPVYAGHIIQEGLVGRRPFAGAALHDELESAAVEIAKQVFGAEHANVQPHSCSQANQAAYHALLAPGDCVLSLDFRAGGHLTHGLRSNFSGRHFRFVHFGVTGAERIDYEQARQLAREHRPRLVVCGSSSYPRLFDAAVLRNIADSVGARLMFDLSHEAGLIAGGAVPNIIPLADVVTMSTDKTLRGPFGGVILCRKELAASIDRSVHPGTQSSFPLRKVAATAQSLALTQLDDFQRYARATLENARELAAAFGAEQLFTGGTEKHYLVLKLDGYSHLDGEGAERRLEHLGILASRQTVPGDRSSRMSDAGAIRLGTPWITSRGYDADDVRELAAVIVQALSSAEGCEDMPALARRVQALVARQRENDVWR